MKRAQSTAEAIRRIKAKKPKTIEDFESIGVPLGVSFAQGAFREVRRPKNKRLALIVKFPVMDGGSTRSGVAHSRSEVRKILKLAKFKEIKKHLPTVHYHHPTSGIVVMKFYPALDGDNFFEKMVDFTARLINKLTGVEMEDIQAVNVRGDGNEGFVFIDLGY